MSARYWSGERVRVGDRVIVRPFTDLLHHPAPGGPGTVVEVPDAGDGAAWVRVLLDDGQRRDPFVAGLTLEGTS